MDARGLPAEHATSPIAVGFSGGLDSTVLLHLLAASRTNGPASGKKRALRAIHVHHGLHDRADAWAAHCREVCAALGIELAVIEASVDLDAGRGPEGAAREARFAAFADALHPGEVLALAHHRDDQAETFLLRALRASGPDGLAAMRAWRGFANGWLWRPLLNTPRAELLAHAQAHGLRWIEDPSNRDTDLDRNFLRQRVLPLLRERWPQADAAFARGAALQAATVDLLDTGDAHALTQARTGDPHVLSVDALRGSSPAQRARALRRWIAALGLPPLPAQGIARIESDLLAAAPDSEAVFAWAGACIHAWRGRLHAGLQREPLPGDWQVEWDGAASLALPTGDHLRLETSSGVGAASAASFSTQMHDDTESSRLKPLLQGATVHARRGGERIVLPGRAHSHALKHVLQALGVPPWERARLPLLSDADGTLLAVGDLASSAAFDAWLRERGTRLVWQRS